MKRLMERRGYDQMGSCPDPMDTAYLRNAVFNRIDSHPSHMNVSVAQANELK